MTIILYTNNSENNRMVKEISEITTLTGTLRNQTSIINPTIIIEIDLTEIANCNYMWIEEFNRFYFIRNITSIRNNIVEITGHCDVLSTYASSIQNCTGIVKRQENIWNLYVDDNAFMTYQNPLVITKAFPSGFTTQSFVLAVAGS